MALDAFPLPSHALPYSNPARLPDRGGILKQLGEVLQIVGGANDLYNKQKINQQVMDYLGTPDTTTKTDTFDPNIGSDTSGIPADVGTGADIAYGGTGEAKPIQTTTKEIPNPDKTKKLVALQTTAPIFGMKIPQTPDQEVDIASRSEAGKVAARAPEQEKIRQMTIDAAAATAREAEKGRNERSKERIDDRAAAREENNAAREQLQRQHNDTMLAIAGQRRDASREMADMRNDYLDSEKERKSISGAQAELDRAHKELDGLLLPKGKNNPAFDWNNESNMSLAKGKVDRYNAAVDKLKKLDPAYSDMPYFNIDQQDTPYGKIFGLQTVTKWLGIDKKTSLTQSDTKPTNKKEAASTPNKEPPKATKRYNPTTGQLEDIK